MRSKKKYKRDWFVDKIQDDMVKNYLNSFLQYTNERLRWYDKHQRMKSIFSNIILATSIISFTSSLIMIIAKSPDEEFTLFNYHFNVYAAGYVFLLIASTLILIDRLFGHSSGWIRYLLTRLEIEKSVGEYHKEWLNAISNLKSDKITPQERIFLINLISNFENAIKSIVVKEISEWKNHFSLQLENFRSNVDKSLQKARTDLENYQTELKQKIERGSLTVQITKPKESTLKISLNSQTLEKPVSKVVEDNQLSASFPELKPGFYDFHCELLINDQPKEILEKVILINPSKITEEEITFEK